MVSLPLEEPHSHISAQKKLYWVAPVTISTGIKATPRRKPQALLELMILRQVRCLTYMSHPQIRGLHLASPLPKAVLTVATASTNHKIPFYDFQQQSHIIMLSQLGIFFFP